MWRTDTREITDNKCPMSGQFLVNLGSDVPHVLDGPHYYESEDGKFKYERSPWAWKKLYLVFPESRVFLETAEGYTEIIEHYGKDIRVDSLFIEEEKNYARLCYEVEKLLNTLRYQRLVREGKIDPSIFPKISQVFPRAVSQELISVQPMESSKGTLFYLDYKYHKRRFWSQFISTLKRVLTWKRRQANCGTTKSTLLTKTGKEL